MLFTPTFIPLLTSYIPNAVDFDGTNDFLSLTTALIGGPTSGKLSGSLWFRLDGGDGSFLVLANFRNSITHNGPAIARTTGNKIQIIAQDTTDASELFFQTTASFTASATWHNILFSYDLNNASGARTPLLYIDGAADLNVTTDTGTGGTDVWGTTINQLNIASVPGGTSKWNGCIAESWYAPGVQIDFTNAVNVAKFISGGKPVNLGSDGTATGFTPLIYLPNAFGTVGANASTGGNFTINGAPAACSSHP